MSKLFDITLFIRTP